MVEILLLLLLFTYAIFLCYWFIPPVFGSPPYYPSNKKLVRNMVEIADIGKDDKVIDLGSGDGRILFEASKHAKIVVGVELNPFLVTYTKVKAAITHTDVQVERKNLYKVNLRDYDVIFCYLLPATMSDLAGKFKQELRPGTRIITNTFHLEGFEQIKKTGKLIAYKV